MNIYLFVLLDGLGLLCHVNRITNLAWDDFVGRSIAGWEVLALVWIRGLKQGGIIYYERLQRETKPELERLTKMLGLTYDEKRLNCVLQHTEDNSFKRDKKKKIA